MMRITCLAAFAIAFSVGACDGPKYPTCDNDEHCTADGHHGVCVNHRCVACRDDGACGTGRQCQAGQCTDAAGYCDSSRPCAAGSVCGADHRCATAQSQAPKAALQCDDDHPCGRGERCENGHCVGTPKGGPGCQDFPAPKFDFDSPTLRVDAKDVLERLAGCLTTGSLSTGRVLLTGHCDSRGEYEYNMSLGAQRAETVKGFLLGLGVPQDRVSTSSRGALDANGTDDTTWVNDRRVDVEVR